MAGDEVEVGDKASWNWNGSAPSGEVSEKKTEGEAAVTSKRGNTIKKSAKPDDPAIALSRSGNDVVKNQSELQVDEKHPDNKPNGTTEGADDPKADGEIPDDEEDDPLEEAEAAKEKGNAKTPKKASTPKAGKSDSKKRKADSGAESAPASAKKAKPEPKKDAPKKSEGTSGAGRRGRPKGTTTKKAVTPTAAGDRKPRGRPKKEEAAKVTKSKPAPKKDQTKAKAGAAGGKATGAKRGRKAKA